MKKMVLGLCLLVLTPAAFAERQALLIGNKNYRVSPLSNPVNDVNGLKNQLVKLGFKKIMVRVNLNKAQMRKTIRDFRAQLRRGDMALVYYSGHGAQVAGRNFLLPVNHGIQEEFEVEDRAVPLNSILQGLANSPSTSNIVILDACRDNPFKRHFKSGTRGLARLPRQAQGTLVAFASSTGGVSNDGRGKYGTYTKHLIQHIATPNISLNEMFTRVRKAVATETHRKQFPIVEDGLLETIYLTKKIDNGEKRRQEIARQQQLEKARQNKLRQEQQRSKAKESNQKNSTSKPTLDVYALQRKLKEQGYYHGPIDGVLDSHVRSAYMDSMAR